MGKPGYLDQKSPNEGGGCGFKWLRDRAGTLLLQLSEGAGPRTWSWWFKSAGRKHKPLVQPAQRQRRAAGLGHHSSLGPRVPICRTSPGTRKALASGRHKSPPPAARRRGGHSTRSSPAGQARSRRRLPAGAGPRPPPLYLRAGGAALPAPLAAGTRVGAAGGREGGR